MVLFPLPDTPIKTITVGLGSMAYDQSLKITIAAAAPLIDISLNYYTTFQGEVSVYAGKNSVIVRAASP